jgi:hypothetical protein
MTSVYKSVTSFYHLPSASFHEVELEFTHEWFALFSTRKFWLEVSIGTYQEEKEMEIRQNKTRQKRHKTKTNDNDKAPAPRPTAATAPTVIPTIAAVDNDSSSSSSPSSVCGRWPMDWS